MPRLDWHSDEFLASIKETLTPRVQAAGDNVLRYAQNLIGIPVEYIGGSVIRSLPGEPPRMDTTALINSLTATSGESGDVIYCDIGTDIFYGMMLEYGWSHVAARPWLGRSEHETEEDTVRIIVEGSQTP